MIGGALALPTSASAQAPDPSSPPTPAAPDAEAERARTLKARGDEAIDSGRPADALTAYTSAYEITHDPALLYNRGRALEALTQYPDALRTLLEFQSVAPPDLLARLPNLTDHIAKLRARVTSLTVACSVEGAVIRLRDRTVGTCPLDNAVTVNAGKGQIEVSAEGYFPFARALDLPGGGATTVVVELAAKVTSGIVLIRSTPTNATVSVDGKRLGLAPVEQILSAGSHAITLEREGYHPTRTSVVVTAGERREVNLSLDAERSVLTRWWFWTGVGVVVAGGVVAAVALTTERAADTGTVPPGVVVSGLAPGIRF